MNLLFVLAMASPEGGGGGASSTLIMFGLIAVIFYFFMIRPQAKKAKDLKKFRTSIGKGDRIVTIGGIHGKIAEVKDETIIIETEGGNRMKVEKSAISMEYTTGAGTSTLQQGASK